MFFKKFVLGMEYAKLNISASLLLRKIGVTSMKEQHVENFISRTEKEALGILMNSDLYFEIPLGERRLLLKHIIEFYRSASPSKINC